MYNTRLHSITQIFLSLSEFGPIFRESFVSFTLDPWYNIENSVFGFPKGSNFLNFVLHGARLSALQEGYFDRSVPGNVTNQLTPLEVLIFFLQNNLDQHFSPRCL